MEVKLKEKLKNFQKILFRKKFKGNVEFANNHVPFFRDYLVPNSFLLHLHHSFYYYY